MDSQYLDSGQTVENLYEQELELLKGMFEDLFSSEVIAGVLEDCDGDVNLAVDTLTKIEGNGTEADVAIDTPSNTNVECDINEEAHIATNTPTNTNVEWSISEVTENQTSNMQNLNAHSYATATVAPMINTNKAKRHRPKNVMPKVDYWTDEIKNIIRYHNEGSCTMVVMRGAPGSGKSYLARVIVDATIGTAKSDSYVNHIFSADDHMVTHGEYNYNVNRLEEVHMKNQARVHKAIKEGRSPIIVDNTNMTTWEMYPYVRDAVQHGYIVELVEPSNPWSTIPSQLAKRNIHGVPKDKIQTMLQKYQGTHTGESLIKYFKLFYHKDKQPPVLRKNPPLNTKSPLEIKLLEKLETVSDKAVNHLHRNNKSTSTTPTLEEPLTQNETNVASCSLTENNISNLNKPKTPNNEMQNRTETDEKILDEMIKVEVEWDNGDKWDSPMQEQTPKIKPVDSSTAPKPQRTVYKERSDNFIEPSMINDDWSKNLQFMESMTNNTASSTKKETLLAQVPIETKSYIMEESVFNYNQHENVIETNNVNNQVEDKNLNMQFGGKTTIQRTLLSGFHVCEQEDKYFINLRKMFKTIPRPVLREIYDNCAGDANWACSIVLDGIKNNTIQTVNTDLSDSEDEVHVECQCEEHNSVIPGISTETTSLLSAEIKPQISPPIFKKKPKKEKNITEESTQVLQNIKKSIKISENHYSPYCLNLKKTRYENKENNDEIASKSNENPLEIMNANSSQNAELGKIDNLNSSSTFVLPDFSSEALPGTSQNNVFRDITATPYVNPNDEVPTTSGKTNLESMDDEYEYEDYDCDTFESDDDRSVFGDSVTVNIGMEFVRILDKLYGRHDFEYPAGVKPVLSIPTKMLYDLNALWVESISHQMDTANTQTEQMIKQDEEFARQVEIELQHEAELFPEEENARALPLSSQSVPSFKEIMETELALAIYEKETKEEWKNKEPQDLAAQMTRRKLYELFPDVSHETLSELLIAHNNCFEATVEILMISTGQGHFLDQTNGVNKFVAEKEKENKERVLLAEQIAALSEEEYPYLFKPGEEKEISMDTVNEMRDKAESHKIIRDRYRNKARFYFERKKFSEAGFYFDLSRLHTTRYETASSYAAAVLVQHHSNMHPQANVIDLHFLRVAEAQVTLDLYINDRLQKMRVNPEKQPVILRIITGRGKHSPGRPRVKPAIMKQLKDRGLAYRQLNPGMLVVRLKASDIITQEPSRT